MAANGERGNAFYRDDEIVVDRDTGVVPRGSAEATKQKFANKLIEARRGEAWQACQELIKNPDQLKRPDGYKFVFVALAGIEKEVIIRQTEACDTAAGGAGLPSTSTSDRRAKTGKTCSTWMATPGCARTCSHTSR